MPKQNRVLWNDSKQFLVLKKYVIHQQNLNFAFVFIREFQLYIPWVTGDWINGNLLTGDAKTISWTTNSIEMEPKLVWIILDLEKNIKTSSELHVLKPCSLERNLNSGKFS